MEKFKVEKSKLYKYVYTNNPYKTERKLLWQGRLGKKVKYFETEREAAKHVDLLLIALGKEPVNILKRK